MQAYLARLNGKEGRPREIVGIFCAQSRAQLYDLIDECCNVDLVEVLELGPGGIYWSKAVDYVVPHPEEIREEAPSLPAGANVADHWLRAVFDENEDQWERLEWEQVSADAED